MGTFIGVFIGLCLVVLVVLRSGIFSCRYTLIPEGTSWKTFYRKQQDRRRERRPGMGTWLIIGGAAGMGIMALALYFLQ